MLSKLLQSLFEILIVWPLRVFFMLILFLVAAIIFLFSLAFQGFFHDDY